MSHLDLAGPELVQPVDLDAIAEQQVIADAFHALGRIPKIDVRKALRVAPVVDLSVASPPSPT